MEMEDPLGSSDSGLGKTAADYIFYVTFLVMMLFFFMTSAAGEKY